MKIKSKIAVLIILITLTFNFNVVAGSKNKAVEEVGKRIVDPYTKYSYSMMIEDAKKLADLYPYLVETEYIGESVEGRKILLIKLGKGEKKIHLNGAHHAREYIASTFLMKMIDEYAFAYANGKELGNYNVTKLLDSVTMHIIPMVNPDGVNLVQNGLDSVKDPDKVKKMTLSEPKLGYRSWKANINGVDLNRNYPTGWKENKSNGKTPGSENYKGTAPATEPEVKAIISNINDNSDITIFATYHTQGQVIYWSDYTQINIMDRLKPLAKGLSKLTSYRLVKPDTGGQSYGSAFTDWTRYTFKKPSFTIELCPKVGSCPYPDKKFDDAWNKAKYTGLFLAKEAVNW